MAKKNDDFELPSNPDDIKRIKNAILEASAQLQMVEDRKAAMADTATEMKEAYNMPIKLFNSLAKTHHKQKYQEVTEENSKFELVYESVLGEGGSTTEDDDDSE